MRQFNRDNYRFIIIVVAVLNMTVKFYGSTFAIIMIFAIIDTWMASASGDFSDFNNMITFDLIDWKEFLIVKIPVLDLDWFVSVGNVLSLNYFFFAGEWGGQWIRLISLLWIGAAYLWAFVTILLPILIELVKATANAFQAINPFG